MGVFAAAAAAVTVLVVGTVFWPVEKLAIGVCGRLNAGCGGQIVGHMTKSEFYV